MGKALNEELDNRSVNLQPFTRFKKEHPDQAVILHFNGKARDPRFHGDCFFAGHWLYFNGCRLLADLKAEPGESVVPVQRPNLFKVNTGRTQKCNEDLAICVLGPDGKPDWSHCEQVQLVSLDPAGKTLKRSAGILNGIESEGFPHLNDWEMVDWSGGLNRHFYWRAAARPPVFNYINHKFVQKGGLEKRPPVPFNLHRMVFAAAVFTDSAPRTFSC